MFSGIYNPHQNKNGSPKAPVFNIIKSPFRGIQVAPGDLSFHFLFFVSKKGIASSVR